MKHQSILVFIVILSVFSVHREAVGRVDFNDGQIHNIDYAIDDGVWVDWLTPQKYTTVNVLVGGSTLPLLAHEDSIVNIFGGSIGHGLNANDRSQLYISGGSIGQGLSAEDHSQVYMSGGSIMRSLSALHDSKVNFSGGSIEHTLGACDNSQVNVSGGLIGAFLHAGHTSKVNFSGGSVGYRVKVSSDGQMYMSGGTVGDLLVLTNNGVLTIDGSNFAVDGAPFGYGELTSIFGGYSTGEPYRHLTGVLASGEPINNGFKIGGNAKIELIPAPGALLLGMIGVGIVGWLRRMDIRKQTW